MQRLLDRSLIVLRRAGPQENQCISYGFRRESCGSACRSQHPSLVLVKDAYRFDRKPDHLLRLGANDGDMVRHRIAVQHVPRWDFSHPAMMPAREGSLGATPVLVNHSRQIARQSARSYYGEETWAFARSVMMASTPGAVL